MLRFYHFPELENYIFEMISQKVGSSSHRAAPVRQNLDQEMPNRRMWRGGPILWSANSPESNPCGFILGLPKTASIMRATPECCWPWDKTSWNQSEYYRRINAKDVQRHCKEIIVCYFLSWLSSWKFLKLIKQTYDRKPLNAPKCISI